MLCSMKLHEGVHPTRMIGLLPVLFCLALMTLLIPTTSFAASMPNATPQNGPQGKSHLVQDAAWVQSKLAGKVHLSRSHAIVPNCPSVMGGTRPNVVPNVICPIYDTQLYTGVTGQTIEPYGYGPDVAGYNYSDLYMWNLCAEGATTNALYYWGIGINSHGRQSYGDPHTTTTWDDTHNRSYLMYLATQTKPPSFGSPGEFAYGPYPSGTTYQGDIRDTLNWEASGHASNWSTYYYYLTWSSSITSTSQLYGDISGDIYNDGKAVVADVNAKYLPDWNTGGKTVNHEIAIVGYNDYNNTYTYIDTCDKPCGSIGAGVYTINQTTLYNAIKDNPYSGGQTGNLIW